MVGFKRNAQDDEPIDDPTAWMLTSPVAQLLLMHTVEIKYMCMFGYTFLHGGYGQNESILPNLSPFIL